MLVLGLHFESQDFILSVGHKVACSVKNHTRKVKDISLSPISGITVFYGCKLNPQLQLVILGLCYTHTGPEENQWEGMPMWRSACNTWAAGGEPSPEPQPQCSVALTLPSPPPQGLVSPIPWMSILELLLDQITQKQDCKLVSSLPLTG